MKSIYSHAHYFSDFTLNKPTTVTLAILRNYIWLGQHPVKSIFSLRHAKHLREMLMGSCLEPYIPAFLAHLEDGQYHPALQKMYLSGVVHFAYWMKQRKFTVRDISDGLRLEFLDHLPCCTCPRPVTSKVKRLGPALRHLWNTLKAEDVLPAKFPDHIHRELTDFTQYMSRVCGLAASTCRLNCQYVGKLLTTFCRHEHHKPSLITPDDVKKYLFTMMKTRSPTWIQRAATGFRCYCRFKALTSKPFIGSELAIPRIANWRCSRVPNLLSSAEMERLLKSCKDHSKRDYAIARCLIDLGLRAGEVANLQLADISWRTGTISLRHTKTRRSYNLPLPSRTGRAIADYLRLERPRTLCRSLFIRERPPLNKPITTTTLHRAIYRAYKRCGLTKSGCHIIRSSVASRLLANGTPLKEIADLLRHRSLDTTAIYAKVDVRRLSSVALPWCDIPQ
jgi:integrase/recombinase XerD